MKNKQTICKEFNWFPPVPYSSLVEFYNKDNKDFPKCINSLAHLATLVNAVGYLWPLFRARTML